MKLLEVQRKALEQGLGKGGFAYYLEMGLGKTLLALTEFQLLAQKGHAVRLVVICPNSFKSGWIDEIQKHGFAFDAHIYNSGSDHANFAWLNKGHDLPPVLIINYEAIRSETTQQYIGKFAFLRQCMLVVDESIQIKTYNSQQTRAVLMMGPMFTYIRLLSGKPMSEGPHDLWAQMRLIGATRDNYFPFKTTYCKMGGFKGKRVVGAQNEEILAAKIEKHIFKASKADWTDLPPKVYTSRQYVLSDEMQRQYRSMANDFVLWLNETENVAVDAFITKYIKLAQIQSGFIIRENETIVELVDPKNNPRFQLVEEILEGIPGKAVVVYVHRYTRQLLQRALVEYNPAMIAGGMDPTDIQNNKDSFNHDTECRVILVQMRAGKYGHTLLGGKDDIDRCSTVVFAENSYSLDDRSQIEDRIHRHGQTADSCLYVDLWGTDLDRRITQALQHKEDIVKATFQHFKMMA